MQTLMSTDTSQPLYTLLRREAESIHDIFREHVSEKSVEPVLSDADCIAATGSGDSYAAAITLAALAGPRAEAVDPLDAVAVDKPRFLAEKGCTLVAISIGGRTRTVIELAEKALSRKVPVVCFTTPGSPLAQRACSHVIETTYPHAPMGVGAARQVVLLGLIAKALGYEPRLGSIGGKCAWMNADVFAGIADSYGSALFAANKFYEVYAKPKRHERLEQLVHAAIYPSKAVAIFYSPLLPRKRIDYAAKTITEAGIKVYKIQGEKNPWDNAVTQTATIIKCLAERATKDQAEKPAYRQHPGLEPLTRLIYE
ncbi:hypothetical protein PYJP_01290 [Pyrofollis japonicus]|nr:hypothetical protein PYJP_01290 [Pyrofollis japonicus]